MEVCRYVVTTYLDGMLEEVEEADRDAILRFHRCACFGSVIDWLNGGMKDDIVGYFRRVCTLQKGWLENFGR